MKRLIMLCLSVGLLAACGAPSVQETPNWEPQIRAANEALLNQGDLDMVPQFCAESYVSHEPEGDVLGRGGIAGFAVAVR